MRILLGCALLALAACAPSPSPKAPPAPPSVDDGRCAEGFAPHGSPKAEVGRLGRRCGAALGLTRVATYDAAPQAEGDAVERWLFRARAGRCYRFLAVGASSVDDLDLAVRDADGSVLTADVGPDRFPVVPPSAPLCTRVDRELTVELAVARGRGPAALEIWAGPP